MNEATDPFLPIVQYGALGLLGYVVWWITRKLNGKIDRNSAAVERLADVLEEHNRIFPPPGSSK